MKTVCSRTRDYGAVATTGDFWTAKAVIINSRFENNTITTGTSGGALYNEMFAEMIVEGCTFTNNSVNNIGGAIYTCYESNLTVRNSTFKWNHAENAGGAIHASHGASTIIIDSVFIENSANTGGAVFSTGYSSLSIMGSSFESNHAGNGGAITSYGNIKVKDSAFKQDTSDGFGGSVFLSHTMRVRLHISRFSLQWHFSPLGGALLEGVLQEYSM